MYPVNLNLRNFAMWGYRNSTLLPPPVTPGSFRQGWDSTSDFGTDGDFFVDAVNGSDSNDGLTPATAFATVNKANDMLTAGVAARVRVMGNGVKYREAIANVKGGASAANRIEWLAYGTDRPIITGADVLTGFTACTIADEPIVGPNWASLYKTTVPTADALASDPFYFNIHEANVKMNLAIEWEGAADNDDFFIENIPDYHTAATVGNSGGFITHYIATAVSAWYTKAQIENAFVMGYTTGNWHYRSEISEFDVPTGEIRLARTDVAYYAAGVDTPRFCLVNLIPAIAQGQWAYTNDGTTTTIYVWPANPANISGEIEISKRFRGFDVSNASNLLIKGLQFRQYVGNDTRTGNGVIDYSLGKNANVTVEECRFSGTISTTLNGPVSFMNVDNLVVKNNSIFENSGGLGIIVQGYVNADMQLHDYARDNLILRNHVHRTSAHGIRFTCNRDTVVAHNLMETTGRVAHAAKVTMYLFNHGILLFGNRFVDSGGYVTWQQSSGIAIIGNYLSPNFLGATPSSDRGIVDATFTADTPMHFLSPADPMDNYIVNNTVLSTPTGIDGTSRNGIHIGDPSATVVVNNVLNNIFHGWFVGNDSMIGQWGGNWNTEAVSGARELSDDYEPVDETFVDYASLDYRIHPSSGVRSKVGESLSAIFATLQARFTQFSDWTLDAYGQTFTPATPMVGASVDYSDGVSPALPMPTAPAQMVLGDWAAATGVPEKSLDITITTPPASNGATIKSYWYTTDGGTTEISLGSAPGVFNLVTESDGTQFEPSTSYNVQVRAKNTFGAGAWSDVKTPTTNALDNPELMVAGDFSDATKWGALPANVTMSANNLSFNGAAMWALVARNVNERCPIDDTKVYVISVNCSRLDVNGRVRIHLREHTTAGSQALMSYFDINTVGTTGVKTHVYTPTAGTGSLRISFEVLTEGMDLSLSYISVKEQ